MCGIIGCIGKDCVEKVLRGLKFLEYRGYDSSGIASIQNKRISIVKKQGRVASLEQSLSFSDYEGSVCIGHTRWATHGIPSDRNAHPFLSRNRLFALVHNGVIENYLDLKNFLIEQSFPFFSETDSEVIVNLIEYHFQGDILQAIAKTVSLLRGSFAFAVISVLEQDKIYTAKKDNPIILSSGEGGAFVCSDLQGISEYAKQCVIPEDYTIAEVSLKGILLFDFSLRPLSPITTVLQKTDSFSLGQYRHYMKKEIDEIPDALSRAVQSYVYSFDERMLYGKDRIVFIGCGTALHAGITAKQLLRELVPSLDCYAESAGEVYFSDYPYETTLFIAISQSGETADTIKAVKKIKRKGGRVVAVCNVEHSSLVRESDEIFLTNAGAEIAVASTKAYNCQLAVLTSLCLDIARFFGKVIPSEENAKIDSLSEKAKAVLREEEKIARFARENRGIKSVFFVGRGLDYCVACEGSLKIKEIAYVHSEAYAASELKHGTLALIEKGVLVVAIITQKNTLDKMTTCLAELRSRGAKIFTITQFSDEKIEKMSDFIVRIPETNEWFMPILSVIPTQLFAYYSALSRGCDIDKPRNLAKSVTVE